MASINNYYAQHINNALAAGVMAGVGTAMFNHARTISPIGAAVITTVQFLAYSTVFERVVALAIRHFTDVEKETAKNLATTVAVVAFCAVPYMVGIPFWDAVGLVGFGLLGQEAFKNTGQKQQTA